MCYTGYRICKTAWAMTAKQFFHFKQRGFMISYLYWLTVIAIALLFMWALTRFINWKAGTLMALFLLFVGWSAYYFYYEQLFVKNFGGVMTVEVPEGQIHLSATWKEDHLWIENYDPKTNTCYFGELSKGHILEGRVTIKNCNPMLPNSSAQPLNNGL